MSWISYRTHLVWLLLMGVGVLRLVSYSGAAGQPSNDKPKWPVESHIERSFDRPTLLLFVHPQCPCSESTIGELERIQASIIGRASVVVAFYQPRGKSTDWVRSSLWERVSLIPGVKSFVDHDGAEMDRFGAQTSGQTYLYSKEGSLVFSGGITPERGHMGDTKGRSAILSYLDGVTSDTEKTLVFGCSLHKSMQKAASL